MRNPNLTEPNHNPNPFNDSVPKGRRPRQAVGCVDGRQRGGGEGQGALGAAIPGKGACLCVCLWVCLFAQLPLSLLSSVPPYTQICAQNKTHINSPNPTNQTLFLTHTTHTHTHTSSNANTSSPSPTPFPRPAPWPSPCSTPPSTQQWRQWQR